MSIVTPDVYSYLSPDPIFPYGEATVSCGLVNRGTINGYGAVTRGFLWQLYDIWTDTQFYAHLATAWTAAAGASISTTWTAASGSSVTTIWTPTQFGIWGEYSP